jgi:hypothetical protein
MEHRRAWWDSVERNRHWLARVNPALVKDHPEMRP